MGIMTCTGLRQTEVVCWARIQRPKLNHATDDCYWCAVDGITKKKSSDSISHERPLLERHDTVVSAIVRLRSIHFSTLQDDTIDNATVSNKCCRKINRAINKAWPYPNNARVSSHFFRSFYVASTFHYFNTTSSLSAWASDVFAHSGNRLRVDWVALHWIWKFNI